jgi:phosphatidylglycerophosphatase C
VPALAIFDLDGTITRSDTLQHYIAGFLLRRKRARLWRVPLLLLPLLRYCVDGGDRGPLKSGVIRIVLGGLPRAELEDWNRVFVARLLDGGVFAEALQQISKQRAAGAHLVLLSASPDLYVPAIGAALGFDEIICTEVRWHADGRLDGALASANRRGEEKARCVRALLRQHAATTSVACGNSRADLPHLRLVSEGVYVNGSAQDLEGSAHIRVERWCTPAVAHGQPRAHTQA